MTDREKAIVMAYTGVCMLDGEKWHIFHEYVEEIMGRSVYTHEMGENTISEEIKRKSKSDFLNICREEECEDCISRENTLKAMIEQLGIRNEDYLLPAEATLYKVVKRMPPVSPMPKMGKWIEHHRTDLGEKLNDMCECSECGVWFSMCELLHRTYCPNCGEKMAEIPTGAERSDKK